MIRGHKRVTVSASIFTMRIKNLLKKIFSFPCSGNKAKRGVESRHSTRNACRISPTVGNGSVLLDRNVMF